MRPGLPELTACSGSGRMVPISADLPCCASRRQVARPSVPRPRLSAPLGRKASHSSVAARLNKESVLRARQSEILAQRLALIFAPENSAPPQLRHHPPDKIIEAAGKIGKLDGEAVRALARQPFLHLVRNARGRANHGQPGMAAEPLRELRHGEVLASGEIDRPLPATL